MSRSTGKKKPATLSEAEIIARVAARTRENGHYNPDKARLAVGIGDDAAVIRSADFTDSARRLNAFDQVVTTDLLIEGVHFSQKYMSLTDIGYKALTVNVSDIAAMGATPAQAFGVLGVPPATTYRELDQLLDGVMDSVGESNLLLSGGDTVSAPQWTIGFTVLGDLKGKPLLRSGAKAGDIVWHCGSIGLSQVGLSLLTCSSSQQTTKPIISEESINWAVNAHTRPTAHIALGRFLQKNNLASSCLDLSDSLAQCSLQLAEASQVGLSLDFKEYPVEGAVIEFTEAMRRWPKGGKKAFSVASKFNPTGMPLRYQSTAEYLLGSAEDYGLLFTAEPSATMRLLKESPVPIRKLGVVVDKSEGLLYRDETGRTRVLERIGFEHM